LGINKKILVFIQVSYLPWDKPLWSPFIDLYSTAENGFSNAISNRNSILIVGLTIPLNPFFRD
jgi:hypothetical protein